MTKEKDNFDKNFKRTNLKDLGIHPPNLDKTEKRIGNTQRSDLYFSRQIENANRKMNAGRDASTAQGLADAVSHYLQARSKPGNSILHTYIDRKTPKTDYTDVYPDKQRIIGKNSPLYGQKKGKSAKIEDNKKKIAQLKKDSQIKKKMAAGSSANSDSSTEEKQKNKAELSHSKELEIQRNKTKIEELKKLNQYKQQIKYRYKY